ncbi:MAG: putative membrane-anchored protein [Polaribacter sp.]|jgi:uncharacterized membrane-anchored protein
MKKWFAMLALVLILSGMNWSILEKEKHLSTGDIVYLKLIPVDPRSLMQGDYMALRFALSDRILTALPKHTQKKGWWHRDSVNAADGFIVATLDENKAATFSRLYKEGNLLGNSEIKLQYRIRNNKVKFATNAFFFQEETAETYEIAKYGQFRVNNKGGLLLTAMYDEQFTLLKP